MPKQTKEQDDWHKRGFAAGVAVACGIMQSTHGQPSMISEPKRGGFMFEGARTAFEAGTYYDAELLQLLAAGLIEPHYDSKKEWVVCDDPPATHQPRKERLA